MQRVRAVGLGLALMAGTTGLTHAQNAGAINYFELFQQLDSNGDRIVDRGEVPESGRAAFDQLAKHADGNADGRIDLEEYQRMLGSLREAFGAIGERFGAIDKNADGTISKDEFTGPEFLFQRADANGDGVLTKDEADKFQPGAAPGTGTVAAGLGKRILAMDKNGDGKVSKDEFAGKPEAFDRLDANKDGFVAANELPGGRGRPAAGMGGGERLRAMDKNKDDKISKDEFTGPAQLFDRLDRNSDGVISKDELPGGRPGAARGKGVRRRPGSGKD